MCIRDRCKKALELIDKKESEYDPVKKHYSTIAVKGTNELYAHSVAKTAGYTEEDLAQIPPEASLGLGCGNSVAEANLKQGDFVLDLGCGAGMDLFLSGTKVGPNGKAVGVDYSEDMVKRGKEVAKKYNRNNVEFHFCPIDAMTFPSNSFDVVISNCVLNLVPEKKRHSKKYAEYQKAKVDQLQVILSLKSLYLKYQSKMQVLLVLALEELLFKNLIRKIWKKLDLLMQQLKTKRKISCPCILTKIALKRLPLVAGALLKRKVLAVVVETLKKKKSHVAANLQKKKKLAAVEIITKKRRKNHVVAEGHKNRKKNRAAVAVLLLLICQYLKAMTSTNMQ
eukprot:TRINITY_DN1213_c0_g1_i3.p1 TRINITY_DN1213_c0_g1~~TRINITY_DN1213_c0_g1_i3.p1  ORF type:complete len:338 (+),score=37.21 TRINITY_DN1213_c0_g1_i3:64-1077(+)